METKFNKEQVCELDERALVNAFEVEELEKRYEMGWIKHASVTASVSTMLFVLVSFLAAIFTFLK